MIVEERDDDKYEYKTVLKCWRCNQDKGLELPELADDPRVKKLVTDIMQSLSSARQSEVKAWEEEITACEHTVMLEQQATGHIEASGTFLARLFPSLDVQYCKVSRTARNVISRRIYGCVWLVARSAVDDSSSAELVAMGMAYRTTKKHTIQSVSSSVQLPLRVLRVSWTCFMSQRSLTPAYTQIYTVTRATTHDWIPTWQLTLLRSALTYKLRRRLRSR